MTADIGTTGTQAIAEEVNYEPSFGFSAGPAVCSVGVVGPSNVEVNLSFEVELIPQVDGGFVVHVPILPSASTQGKDADEALKMVTENLEGLLEDLHSGALALATKPEYIGRVDQRSNVNVRCV